MLMDNSKKFESVSAGMFVFPHRNISFSNAFGNQGTNFKIVAKPHSNSPFILLFSIGKSHLQLSQSRTKCSR